MSEAACEDASARQAALACIRRASGLQEDCVFDSAWMHDAVRKIAVGVGLSAHSAIQIEAAWAVCNLANVDAYVRAFAEQPQVLSGLVSMLESTVGECQDHAAWALSSLCSSASSKVCGVIIACIVDFGVMDTIARVVAGADLALQRVLTWLLSSLARASCRPVAQAWAACLPQLIELLHTSVDQEVLTNCAWAVVGLSQPPTACKDDSVLVQLARGLCRAARFEGLVYELAVPVSRALLAIAIQSMTLTHVIVKSELVFRQALLYAPATWQKDVIKSMFGLVISSSTCVEAVQEVLDSGMMFRVVSHLYKPGNALVFASDAFITMCIAATPSQAEKIKAMEVGGVALKTLLYNDLHMDVGRKLRAVLRVMHVPPVKRLPLTAVRDLVISLGTGHQIAGVVLATLLQCVPSVRRQVCDSASIAAFAKYFLGTEDGGSNEHVVAACELLFFTASCSSGVVGELVAAGVLTSLCKRLMPCREPKVQESFLMVLGVFFPQMPPPPAMCDDSLLLLASVISLVSTGSGQVVEAAARCLGLLPEFCVATAIRLGAVPSLLRAMDKYPQYACTDSVLMQVLAHVAKCGANPAVVSNALAIPPAVVPEAPMCSGRHR